MPVLVQVATGLFFVGVGWKSISTLERLMEKLETRMERITDRFDDYVPQREFDEKSDDWTEDIRKLKHTTSNIDQRVSIVEYKTGIKRDRV
jgi:hypothetical protein